MHELQLAYAQVFCNALGAVLWSTTGITQLVFGAMVVPLSCMELEEQLGLQSIMASVRFIAIFVIAAGSLIALFLDSARSIRESPPYYAEAEPANCELSYTSCFSGFSVAFSTFVFAQLFQHSVPGLLRPLRDQPSKMKRVPTVLGASLLTTLVLYGESKHTTLLSAACAILLILPRFQLRSITWNSCGHFLWG